MELHFTTKEESKKIAQKEFLAMQPMERFWTFVRLSFWHNVFYGVEKTANSKTFMIEKKKG